MNRTITVFFLLFVMSGVTKAQDNQYTSILMLNNKSAQNICMVDARPYWATTWSYTFDLHNEPITPNSKSEFQLPHGVYIIELFNCNEESLYLKDYVDANQPMFLSYPDEAANDEIQFTQLNLSHNRLALQGKLDKDLIESQKILALWQKSGNSAAVVIWHNVIAVIYQNKGEFDNSANELNLADEANKQVNDVVLASATLHNRGTLSYIQGENEQAISLLEKARDLLTNVDNNEDVLIPTENVLAKAYLTAHRIAPSLHMFQEVLASRRKNNDRAGVASTLTAIGTLYLDENSREDAYKNLSEALNICIQDGNQLCEAYARISLGHYYIVFYKEYDKTIVNYNRVLDIARASGAKSLELDVLNEFCLMYEDRLNLTGKTVSRIAIVRHGNTVSEESVNIYAIDQVYWVTKTDVIGTYRKLINAIESLLNSAQLDKTVVNLGNQYSYAYKRIAELMLNNGESAGGLDYLERVRSMLLRAELSNAPIDFFAHASQSILHQGVSLQQAINIAQENLNALNENIYSSTLDKQKAAFDLQQARQDYQSYLEANQLSVGYVERQVVNEVSSVAEIQRVLPNDTTLITFSMSNEEPSLVYLVTKTSINGRQLNTTSEQIETLVKAFAADPRANADTLKDLYILLITPIVQNLTTSHLIISPDGPLNYVPFAALNAPDGSYLIDHFAISMIPSGTALVLLNDRKSTPATKPPLILAQANAPGLDPLHYARDEAIAIAGIVGTSANTDATEADLRENITGSLMLTISAHAELDRTNPLFSTIYLRDTIPTTNAQNDGRLEVREIYELNLSSTKLVVLSGCETGLGDEGDDFGVMTRAFLAAGTKQVVASLWRIDDAATNKLMTEFFFRVNPQDSSKTDTADALRIAMLNVKGNPQYADPYFWASFVIVGFPNLSS